MRALSILCVLACASPAPHEKAAPSKDMLEIGGAWLRVTDEGSGPPVVFVHGYGSRLEAWRAIDLPGRRKIALDQRGFGKSERTRGAYGPEAHARDVVDVLNALGVERAILVGHSYGAGVVLRVALRHPERVAGIVLVSPFALEEQLNNTFYTARLPLVGEAMFTASYASMPGEKYLLAFEDRARFATVEAIDEAHALMSREGSSFAALETVRGMDYADVQGDYKTITAPIHIVWGENDRVTPIKTAATFSRYLPQARFTRVEKCGHMPPWEAPQSVVAAIEQVSQ